ESLQIAGVVEVGDEHVVLLERSGGHRRDDDRIRVLVAVFGNGRSQDRLPMDAVEEARRLSGGECGVRRCNRQRRPCAERQRPAALARKHVAMSAHISLSLTVGTKARFGSARKLAAGLRAMFSTGWSRAVRG